jgi:hypothetical protein
MDHPIRMSGTAWNQAFRTAKAATVYSSAIHLSGSGLLMLSANVYTLGWSAYGEVERPGFLSLNVDNRSAWNVLNAGRRIDHKPS